MGDGQIGDVLKIRSVKTSGGVEVQTTSQPAAPQTFSTAAQDRVRTAVLGVAEPQIGSTAGVLKNTLTGYQTTVPADLAVAGKLQAGGPNAHVTMIEVDLSRFMTYTDDAAGIKSATVKLNGLDVSRAVNAWSEGIRSVAVNGNTLAVGAGNGTAAGSVYLFEKQARIGN